MGVAKKVGAGFAASFILPVLLRAASGAMVAAADLSRSDYVSPAIEEISIRSCQDLCANPILWFEAIVPEDRRRVRTSLSVSQPGLTNSGIGSPVSGAHHRLGRSARGRGALKTTLRLIIADDHEVVRRGLRALLESQPGWQVVAEAANGREAAELAHEHQPDIVILDIGMPELNGLEATARILKEVPRTQVLILTVHESQQVIREVLAAGARGYLMKSDASRDLVAAVEALRQRRPYFTSKVAEMMLEGYLKPGAQSEDETANRLTPREREIVQLLAEGKTNKEVASILNISVKTAETHRTNIMNKLQVHSMSELVRYAIRNHIIEP